jgi:hemolysin III
MDADALTALLGRDPFHVATHLLGVLFSLAATYVLVRRARRNGMQGRGVGVYGLMMSVAFSASVLFHFVEDGSPRYDLYNKLDHSAIFLMIAGTGTAIYAAFQARWTDYLTGALWTVALMGILLKLTLWPMPDWLTASIYVAVGWLGGIGVLALARRADARPVSLFVVGAVVFSLGGVVYAVGWPSPWAQVVGPHGVFHVLVLAGAAFHVGFVYRHCTDPIIAGGTTRTQQTRSAAASA